MKITGLRSFLYEYEFNRPIGDVHLPDGAQRRSNLALFIDTDEGLVGEAVGFSWAHGALNLFEPALLGADPRSVRGVWEQMQRIAFKPGLAGALKSAIAVIDCALWDLRAKVHGVPLWKELGASSNRVPAYASGLDTPLDDDALSFFYGRLAKLGFNAGKLKVGVDQEDSLRRLRIMRDALATSGQHPIVMVDANEYWSPKQAIRRVTEMEAEFDLYWVEEPANRWDYRGLKKVSDSIRAAVATGENLHIVHDYMPLVDHGAVDIIQMGMATCGITGALQVAELAYAYGLQVSMMNCPGNFMAHAAAVMPHHTMMEVLDAGRDQAFKTDIHLEDGHVILGDSPGSGVSFDADLLDQYRVQESSKNSFAKVYRRSPGSGVDEFRSRRLSQPEV